MRLFATPPLSTRTQTRPKASTLILRRDCNLNQLYRLKTHTCREIFGPVPSLSARQRTYSAVRRCVLLACFLRGYMIRPFILAASICSLATSAHSATIRASSGATAKVADRAAGPFQCLINKLEEAGYRIQFMGGYRRHGSRRQSLHPAGLALDINQYARNVTRPRMPRSEIAIANSCGVISGAQWASRDSGHFQLGGWSGQPRRYAKRNYRRSFARMR